MSEAATYGEAMHRAWQRFFEHMLSRKNKAFPSEKRLIDYFEEELKNLRHQLSDGEFRRRLEMGRKSLSHYFQNELSSWKKEVRLEFNIKNCEIEGVPVTGTIDKLVFLSNLEVNIVDY